MASTLSDSGIRWANFTIPSTGIPHLECELVASDEADQPTGTTTLTLEGSTYLVTVQPGGGNFAGRNRVSACGGYGGWSTTIPAKGYQSPLGIASAKLITDAARECGEVPGSMPATVQAGHYARRRGAASRVLSDFGGTWWVDSAGITQTGDRSTLPITDPDLSVLDFDAADGEIWLGVGDVSQYTPGRTITADTLPNGPVTLDLITVHVKGNELRVQAWIV